MTESGAPRDGGNTFALGTDSSSPVGLNTHWIDRFIGMILSPSTTLESIAAAAEWKELPGGIALVVLVMAMDGARTIFPAVPTAAIFSIILGIASGLLLWLSFASLMALLGCCFGISEKGIKAVFATTAWACAPAIFITPLFCYRWTLGPCSILLGGILWLWIVGLQILAVGRAFKLHNWQVALLFLVAPILFGLFQFMQWIGAVYDWVVTFT